MYNYYELKWHKHKRDPKSHARCKPRSSEIRSNPSWDRFLFTLTKHVFFSDQFYFLGVEVGVRVSFV